MEHALILLAISLLLNVFHKFDAVLNVSPRDTEVMVNESTYMNCSTSFEAEKVQWHHGNKIVYTGRDILEPYNFRFSVEINSSTGTSNLVIRSVQPSDAGQYECLEDEGVGERRSAQLIVLDDYPVCKSSMRSSGVIGPNTCGVEPDEVKLSCSIPYHGDTFPILQWKASRDNQSIIGLLNFASNKKNVTYTLTMKSTLDLNDSSFICQTTRTSKKHYSCSSEVIKILYVFSSNVTINMTMDDEVSCFANTSQSCSYKWKWFSGDDSNTVSKDQVLIPTRVGWHRCEATCFIGSKSCTVEPMYAEVIAASGQNLLTLLVLFILPVIVLIGVVIYCRRKAQIGKQGPSTSEELIPLENQNIEQQGQSMSEYKSEFGEELPLTAKEISILIVNLEILIDLLILADLLGCLYSSKVLDEKQMYSISLRPTSYEKNETLIYILQTCKLRDYHQTITCLHQSKQSHIAEILDKGGAVVRVHANLDGENVTETEKEIVAEIAKMLSDRPLLKVNRISGRVIAAKTGNSIVLYIYCRTIEELEQLHESLTSGHLKESVELWFNRLRIRSQKIKVSALTFSTEEFKNMRSYFKASAMSVTELISGYGPLKDFFCAEEGLSLKADNNRFLSVINRSNIYYIEAAKQAKDESCKFFLELLDNEKVRFKDIRGYYLSRIFRTEKNNIEAEKLEPDVHCEFLVYTRNGKVILKADNGLFLSRIYYCVAEVHRIEAAKHDADQFCEFVPSSFGDLIMSA